ncbi:MAG: carboxypeptidase regulatory-like domain-containing protein [Phycisphaerae bacterium]
MATLTIKKIKCIEQEDWTGDDDIKIVVHAATRREVWRGAMDTGQMRNLGNLEAEFTGSARIQLLEVDWPDGDDNLGSVTVNESAAAAVDYEARFTRDDANYTVWYRVSTADATSEPQEGGERTCDPPEDDPDAEGPQCRENAGSEDGTTECPMGDLAAHVTNDDGQPIEGATVRLVELELTGQTDANGNHEFGAVQQGDYTVEARKEAYAPDPASTSVHVSRGRCHVAELTLSGVLVSITPNEDQKWYVNQPADEAGHHGRAITITAQTTPATAGIRIYFTLQADPTNKTGLPAALEAGLSPEQVVTGADGKAETTLTLSRYGGDKFRVGASLNAGTAPGSDGSCDTGWFEVWRKLYYETDCMARPGGGSYSNRANHAGLRSAMRPVFLEVQPTGADSAPAHRRVIRDNEARAWAAGLRTGGGRPRYFHLIFLDTIAVDPEPFSSTWQLPTLRTAVTLQANAMCLDPRDWFVSATYTDTGPGGATGAIPAGKFRLDVDTPTHNTYRLHIDLSGIAGIDPTVNPVDVRVTFNKLTELSGLQYGPATIIGIRWRERAFSGNATRLSNSTLNTMMHEPGHALGLAATTYPTGGDIGTTYFSNGHHCNNTPRCLMYHENSGATAFCPNCKDACRGRNLESLPQSGSAGYA